MKKNFANFMFLLTIIIMEILGGAEIDLFVPSFPEIKNYFDLTTVWVEALLSVNFAGFCISLFLVGSLADRYGRKPIIILGLSIFIVGSILCLKAASLHYLLVGRFLQGFGIAAPATLCFLIIADTYSLKKQQYFMSMLNGLVNASVAVAPIAGSYLTKHFHWQGNFTVLLFFGIVVLVMTVLFIPFKTLSINKEKISFTNYKPIFRSKQVLLMIACLIFMFEPYWIFIGMSPILYMEDLGVSLSQFGFYQGTLALIFGLGSIFLGLIINKYDQKRMLYISGIIGVMGIIIIAGVTFLNIRDPLIITLAFLPYVIGSIIPSTIIFPLCINFLPEMKGRVSAIIQGSRLIMGALGLELAGYCYRGSFQNLGIIITIVITASVITLFLIIRNFESIRIVNES